MKTQELIKLLQKAPGDAEVYIDQDPTDTDVDRQGIGTVTFSYDVDGGDVSVTVILVPAD